MAILPGIGNRDSMFDVRNSETHCRGSEYEIIYAQTLLIAPYSLRGIKQKSWKEEARRKAKQRI